MSREALTMMKIGLLCLLLAVPGRATGGDACEGTYQPDWDESMAMDPSDAWLFKDREIREISSGTELMNDFYNLPYPGFVAREYRAEVPYPAKDEFETTEQFEARKIAWDKEVSDRRRALMIQREAVAWRFRTTASLTGSYNADRGCFEKAFTGTLPGSGPPAQSIRVKESASQGAIADFEVSDNGEIALITTDYCLPVDEAREFKENWSEDTYEIVVYMFANASLDTKSNQNAYAYGYLLKNGSPMPARVRDMPGNHASFRQRFIQDEPREVDVAPEPHCATLD